MKTQPCGLTIQAQLWTGDGGFVPFSTEIPELSPGQAVARVDLATICGSDIHTVSGRRRAACPSILGHEAVGTLVGIGPGGVRDAEGLELNVGDRIVWGVTVSCGTCDRCLRGLSAKCRALLKTGHESLDSPWGLSGGYASHILLPKRICLVAVPEELGDAVAAPAACATATVMAAMEAAGPLTSQRVLVSGAGMLGIVACAVAAQAGASEIIAKDLSPERLELARCFGATGTRIAGDPSQSELFDVAVELSGSHHAVNQALDSLDIGGRLVLVGSVSPGPAVSIDPERMVRSLLSIAGVHNYEPRHLQQAIKFLTRTRDIYDWDSLVAPARPAQELGAVMEPPTGRILRNAVSYWL